MRNIVDEKKLVGKDWKESQEGRNNEDGKRVKGKASRKEDMKADKEE